MEDLYCRYCINKLNRILNQTKIIICDNEYIPMKKVPYDVIIIAFQAQMGNFLVKDCYRVEIFKKKGIF